MFEGKSLLITGGTGKLGHRFVQRILQSAPGLRRLIIFSRDELKQFEMAQKFPVARHPQMRFFIGDVRDGDRLRRACEGVDFILHASAMRNVEMAERNPTEYIHTNVGGTENVVNAAIHCGVQKVIGISTDQAAAPESLYGATKLCSEKLLIAANRFVGSRDLHFSVVRRDSASQASLDECVDLILFAMTNAWGGEVFVPKHCVMMPTEAMNAFDCGSHNVISPATPTYNLTNWQKAFQAKRFEFETTVVTREPHIEIPQVKPRPMTSDHLGAAPL